MNKLFSEPILIGTRNVFKKDKLKWLVGNHFSTIEYIENFGELDEEIPERGKSFAAISANKARSLSRKYPGYVISSDSGVDIPALGNQWNALKTKRFVYKKNATDFDRMDALLELMKSKEGSERIVYWKEAIAIAKNCKVIYCTESKSCPMILQKNYDPRKYKKGIWLCSLFHYPQYNKNYFDLTKEELDVDGEDTWWELKDKTESFFNHKKEYTKENIYTFDLSKYSINESILESLEYNIIISPNIKHYKNILKETMFKKPLISPFHIAAAMISTNEDITAIHPKTMLSRITFKIHKDTKKVTCLYNNGVKEQELDLKKVRYSQIKTLLHDHKYLSSISAYLKSLANKGFILVSFSILGRKTSTFIINSREGKMPFNKFSKIHIRGTLNKRNIKKISNTAVLNQKLIHQQNALLQDIEKKEIITSKEIDLINEWPRNPYIENIKRQISEKVKNKLSNTKISIDWRDLLLQVLFRSTTYSPRSLFLDGANLLNYLEGMGIYENWRNIPNLSDDELIKYKINKDIIDQLIEEQLLIALNRLTQSKLNVKEFFNFNQYFNGKWKIVWKENDLFITDGNKVKKVVFKPVDPKLATMVHNQFHYMHTPRAAAAFGLFIKGSKYPFSVESVEYLKRNYKKNSLLLFGYNPINCIELTRLYNRPFSPMGTSSVMDRMIFEYYNREFPEIEAVSTTIMPDYAFSKSQIAGPVSKVYLVTKKKHTFAERKINSQIVYGLVTNKKIEDENLYGLIQSHPKAPLLPVFQVLHQITEKSFKDIDIMNGKMIELTQ